MRQDHPDFPERVALAKALQSSLDAISFQREPDGKWKWRVAGKLPPELESVVREFAARLP